MWGSAIKLVLKAFTFFTDIFDRKRKQRDATLESGKKKVEEGLEEDDPGKITSGFDDINDA